MYFDSCRARSSHNLDISYLLHGISLMTLIEYQSKLVGFTTACEVLHDDSTGFLQSSDHKSVTRTYNYLKDGEAINPKKIIIF